MSIVVKRCMRISNAVTLLDKINTWICSFAIAASLIFCSQQMFGQVSGYSVPISGTVRTFSDSTVLAGVKVFKDGFVIAETDSLGRFELIFSGESVNDTLEFSFPGFLNEKRTCESKELNVYMDSIATPLAGRIGPCLVSYRWWTPRAIWWRIKSVFRKNS